MRVSEECCERHTSSVLAFSPSFDRECQHKMYLCDILATLRRGMHVRVWAETIWPESKAVAIIYDGIFMALTPEKTQTPFEETKEV